MGQGPATKVTHLIQLPLPPTHHARLCTESSHQFHLPHPSSIIPVHTRFLHSQFQKSWKKQEYPSCVIFFASSSTHCTELQMMMLWLIWCCVCGWGGEWRKEGISFVPTPHTPPRERVESGDETRRVYSSVHVVFSTCIHVQSSFYT